DSETRARELVQQTVAELRRNQMAANVSPSPMPPAGSIPGTAAPDDLKAKRDLIKQQEREGKKRRAEEKKLEDQAKKEANRLDREGTATARERARKQLEAEAKARDQGKPLTSKMEKTSPGAPLKLSGTKRQRLDQLTDAYIHDQIGPEEYHRERGKIVAEPS